MDLLNARPKPDNCSLPCSAWQVSLDRIRLEGGKCYRLLLCILLSTLALAGDCPVAPADPFALRDSTQLLVVATPEWNSMFGVLQRYERSGPANRWTVWDIRLPWLWARTGLVGRPDPRWRTREGTEPGGSREKGRRRTLAGGFFRLGTAFGYVSENRQAGECLTCNSRLQSNVSMTRSRNITTK